MPKISCPKCHSTRLTKHAKQWRAGKQVQRYQCQNCGGITVNPTVIADPPAKKK